MRNCPKCGPGYPRTSPTGVGISHSHPAVPAEPDRPGDRDQQQAANREIRGRLDVVLSRYGGQLVTMDVADALVPVVRELVDAARAEEAARWRAKIEALRTEVESEADRLMVLGDDVSAARLRAVLDGERR